MFFGVLIGFIWGFDSFDLGLNSIVYRSVRYCAFLIFSGGDLIKVLSLSLSKFYLIFSFVFPFLKGVLSFFFLFVGRLTMFVLVAVFATVFAKGFGRLKPAHIS